MIGLTSGINGMKVAQQMINIIGDNISNAATDGYHRQDAIVKSVELNPYQQAGGGGVEIESVRRIMDVFLEAEYTNQQTQLGTTEQELSLIRTIENFFGELDSGSLTSSLNEFYQSLDQLSGDPGSLPLRSQFMWAADAVAGRLRTIAGSINKISDRVTRQLEESITEANNIIAQIAELNARISEATLKGGSANTLKDQRQQEINKLAELVEIQTFQSPSRPEGIEISAWGKSLSLLVGNEAMALDVGTDEEGNFGIALGDSEVYDSNISTGKLGALINMANQVIPDLQESLDNLANDMINTVNRIHVQGVGAEGGFNSLTSRLLTGGTVAEFAPDAADGSFFIRVVNQSTSAAERHEISLDVSNDTAADVAARLDAVNGLTSAVAGGKLRIEADEGFKFDFRPAVTAEPTTSNITGDAEATVSGLYTGDENQTITCTVVGTGQVGADDSLILEVRNGAGELVKRVNIGSGYAPPETVEIGMGLEVSFTPRQLNDGDMFTIQALADTDPTNFLADIEMNTLFTGGSAINIGVNQELVDNPARLGVSAGAEGTDSANLRRLSGALAEQSASLDGMNPLEYTQNLITEIGQSVAARQARRNGLKDIIQQLTVQRSDISGVDVNEEAAKLISYERMFQATSKVIQAQNESLKYLFNMI